ncbi:YtxH domain-containing protein [Flavobacterium sp.]|jgi:gas vesicle protein|uniref:YtxH domain-containing protein n=1 Tax=Flavobacterium sp. TaxID=239 RepID=UPI0037BF94CA
MKNNQVILGVLGGLAAGALLGILFAPHKGSKTRKMILNKGEDYAGELKNKFDSLYENVTNQYNGVMKDAKEYVSKNVEV